MAQSCVLFWGIAVEGNDTGMTICMGNIKAT